MRGAGWGSWWRRGRFGFGFYRIAHAKAARLVAREVRERGVVEAMGEARELVAEGPADFDAEAAHAALGKLPAEMRAALTLFYLEEMSLEEIAGALDCPVGTVKSRLHNGRRELRRIISKENL